MFCTVIQIYRKVNMGFHVEINSILRSDDYSSLEVGEIRAFKKLGSRVFFDDIPVWLTRSDWTALAEIHVRSQTRVDGDLKGEFEVLHVYSGSVQQELTQIFKRMYADKGSSFIYVLMNSATLKTAQKKGEYAPTSLKTEKFIHASPSDQLTRVANKYYSDNEMVHVVVIKKTLLMAQLKWEEASSGGLYPHIYGPLNMDAMVEAIPFFKKKSGFEINLQEFSR